MVAVRHPSSAPHQAPVRAIRIVDGGQEQIIALTTNRTFVLGRSDRAEVIFHNDRVSRLHGMLWWQDGHWRYRDVGSANGSFVYEARDFDPHEDEGMDLPVELVPDGEGRPLAVGEGILLGTRTARIELLAEVPADAWASGDPHIVPRGVIDNLPTEMFGLAQESRRGSVYDSISRHRVYKT